LLLLLVWCIPLSLFLCGLISVFTPFRIRFGVSCTVSSLSSKFDCVYDLFSLSWTAISRHLFLLQRPIIVRTSLPPCPPCPPNPPRQLLPRLLLCLIPAHPIIGPQRLLSLVVCSSSPVR
ncbi:hypothetical protein FB451DRAFT_1569848, partial [Mycena latifolia]